MSQTLKHTVWRPGTWTILRISVLLVASAQLPAAAGGYAAQSVPHNQPHLRPSSSQLFQHTPHHNIRHQHYESHGESVAGYLAPLPRTPANANTHHNHQQRQQQQQQQQQYQQSQLHQPQHPHQLHQPPQRQLKPKSHQHQQHFHQSHHKPINATHKFTPTTSTPTTVTATTATTAAAAATVTPIKSATTIRTATRATSTPVTKAATFEPLTTKAASAPQNYYRPPAGSEDNAQRQQHQHQQQQQQQQPQPQPQQKRQQNQPTPHYGHHNHKLQPASHLRTAKPVIAHSPHEPGHGGGKGAAAHAHNQSAPLATASGAGSEPSPLKATHDRHEQLSVAHNALSTLKKKSLADQYADAVDALEAAVSAGEIDDIDDYDYSDEAAYGEHDERADSSYDDADDNADEAAADSVSSDNHQQHKWAQQHQQQQQQQHQQQQQEWRTRVTRDHHRLEPPPQHNHLAYAARTDDEDYADDEPSRGSDEQFGDNIPGKLTQQKFEELGTREAVQQTRERYMQEQERLRQKTPTELAIEHRNRMKVAAKCSRPLPRVFHVSNDTSKTYLPHCTILHRCGEDTGCCPSMGQVCTAKSYEDVPLYFFVSQVNTKRFQTEVLWLRNDTECHCVDRANLTDSPEFITRGKRSGHTLRRHASPPRAAPDYSEEDADGDDNANAVCRCPRYFDAVEEDVAGHLVHQRRPQRSRSAHTINCRCECLNAATACQRFKNGEEGFAMDDRRCISEGLCSAPNCSYGPYSHRIGRCPRPSKKHKRHDSGFG